MDSVAVDLSSRNALVTGAGRGIGRAVAEALASKGAKVYLAARTAPQLEAAADAIRATGGSAVPVPTDLRSEAEVEALFDRIRKESGGPDILVNNAGVGIFGPVVDASPADFDAVMQVNAKAAFLCCRLALRSMIPRKRGAIINVSSVVGFKGYPNQGIYTASKHAILGLTKSLAAETEKHGIRVSAVLPGGVDTQMIADARPDLDPRVLLQPEDIAHAVLFLLSLSERAAIDQIYIRRRER